MVTFSKFKNYWIIKHCVKQEGFRFFMCGNGTTAYKHKMNFIAQLGPSNGATIKRSRVLVLFHLSSVWAKFPCSSHSIYRLMNWIINMWLSKTYECLENILSSFNYEGDIYLICEFWGHITQSSHFLQSLKHTISLGN